MEKDYYKILGVEKNATEAEIKKAFRSLSKKWHPDKYENDTEEKKKEADERFKEINEAYSVLSDQEKRKMYDLGADPNQQYQGGFGGFDFSNFGFGNGFNDDFGFGNMGFNPFGSRRKQPKNGSDINVAINITAEEAYTGVRKNITFKRREPCSHCNGTGSEDGIIEKCQYCGGTGRIIVKSGSNGYTFFQTETTCPYCGGTGRGPIRNVCRECNGTGYKETTQTININIPAGVFQKTALILSGYGDSPSDKSGENGNLIVTVYVSDDDKYIRDGNDLIAKLKLTAEEAWLGTKKEIVLPDKSTITVNVPEMTKPEDIISIFEGKGYPNMQQPNIRGNFIVVSDYEWPNKLTKEQKDLLKEFFNIENNK